ncbi:MAG: bifunctional folylpolyglutamate synthase/dihydrofolate synthase [Rhodospirillaceae bacterium]|nr:bifunctional folylpolyglutamate synthase/dihydrofolate synthase [Rhodospirillaceae bacterium]
MTGKPAEASGRILARLQQLHPKLIDLSLGRMERLLKNLGNPETRLPPVIHIAGTNGKGSTLAYLDAILSARGQRVDSYVSPHLVHFNERIRLAGRDIDEAQLTALLAECEAANEGAPITFFEITTAAALLAFERSAADILLLEVGLGGRLDATNVVARPALSAITPVSIDHTQYLGDTLVGIAAEKAGILKAGVPAVIGAQMPAALAAIEDRAATLGTPLLRYGVEWDVHPGGDGFNFESSSGKSHFPLPALAGAHQIGNAGIAIACVEVLAAGALPHAAITEGLAGARWPGRLQQISLSDMSAGWEVWLDGGHNAAAGEALAAARDWTDKPLHLIIGMINSKAPEDFLRPLAPLAASVTGVAVPGETASLTPEDISAAAAGLGLPNHEAKDVKAALAWISRQDGPGRILVCGSLYLVGDVLACHTHAPNC